MSVTRLHRRTILVVEDDPGHQELVRRAVASERVDVDLSLVSDGEQALDYLLRRGRFARADVVRPDLVLLDLNMPRADGRAVLHEMGRHGELRPIPVVVFSGSNRQEDIRDSYALGCRSFVTKPPDFASFRACVRQLIDYWFSLVSLPDN